LYEYYQVRDLVTAYAKVPFYCVVGNHDAAATDGLENFEYFFGELYYSFDYGNSHFIFLCTELDDQKGLITGGQLAWLEDELSSNTDKDHIFIAAHQPIYPVFHGIENQEEVQSLIEQYDNVTAIFQGHEHTYYHEVLDSGADNFVTGGGTWLDSQYLVENTFTHYFIITVTGDTMEWRLEKTSQLFVEDPLRTPTRMRRRLMSAAIRSHTPKWMSTGLR
ncbi:MAG TPA: metallophosphoesterase, partial [Candidatus Methanofastidiosa archaeon]|nr:metallophosphoesterase [Candidatus Methanofastidiosa archaeon]